MKIRHFVLTALFFILPALAAAADDNAVLVKVNNSQITAEQFKRQLEVLTPDILESVVADEKARREFVNDLIGIELVIQEALIQGLDKTEEFKKSQEETKQRLKQNRNIDPARKGKMLEESARNQLFSALLKKALAGKLEKIPVPGDQEVAAYYREHEAKMVDPDGKKLPLQDAAPRLKQRIKAEKQRALYLEFVKTLRATAGISVDENAIKEVLGSLPKTRNARSRQ